MRKINYHKTYKEDSQTTTIKKENQGKCGYTNGLEERRKKLVNQQRTAMIG